MITAALSRSAESGAASPRSMNTLAESNRSANALRSRATQAVSPPHVGLTLPVSHTAPSTIALAIRRLLAMSLGSMATACRYAHTAESALPASADAEPRAFQKLAERGKRVVARALNLSNAAVSA